MTWKTFVIAGHHSLCDRHVHIWDHSGHHPALVPEVNLSHLYPNNRSGFEGIYGLFRCKRLTVDSTLLCLCPSLFSSLFLIVLVISDLMALVSHFLLANSVCACLCVCVCVCLSVCLLGLSKLLKNDVWIFPQKTYIWIFEYIFAHCINDAHYVNNRTN